MSNSILNTINYGYSVATNKRYVAVGNPAVNRYTSSISDKFGTGSVDVLVYNTEIDQYEHFATIKKYVNTENVDVILNTEDSDKIVTSAEFFLSININTGDSTVYDDSYGKAVALYNDILVIGNPRYTYSTTDFSQILSGSTVDIYDLTNLSSSGLPLYTISNSFDSDYNTTTFGESVSIYNDFLIVGSSNALSRKGAAYIYTQSANTWVHYQTLTGSNAGSGSLFGSIVKIDQSGSNRIIVGNGATGSAYVYVFGYNTSSGYWTESKILSSNRTLPQTLNFISCSPYITSSSNPDGYGNSVAIYGDSIAVGAPTDTFYYEYTGSSVYRQRGAVYFYQSCNSSGTDWYLLQKSFGSEDLRKTNKLAMSIDMYETTSIVSSTYKNYPYSSSYILNTLNKKYDCNVFDNEYDTLGQIVIYSQSTSSYNWNILKTISKKKEYGYPYSPFGYKVSLYSDIFVVGCPLLLTEYSTITSSNNSVIQGCSYIYNFNDFKEDAQIGNVFYKNGKFIFSNSGSIFDNLLKDRTDLINPLYDVTYKSKLTLYENQIICRIEPGEFNYSTNPTSLIPNSFDFDFDHNQKFDFIDVDLILRYISFKINGSYDWANYMEFDKEEQSLLDYYNTKFNLSDVPTDYINLYSSSLSSSYQLFDFDKNNKINRNEMYILWKWFIKKLSHENVFKYVELKSTNKTIDKLLLYLNEKTGQGGYNTINPEFFDYDINSESDITGSYLAPYITTVGLYSGLDLVAVAKLATPIKNTGEFPLNIIVKWDI